MYLRFLRICARVLQVYGCPVKEISHVVSCTQDKCLIDKISKILSIDPKDLYFTLLSGPFNLTTKKKKCTYIFHI